MPEKILLIAPHPFYQERGTPIAVDLLIRALTERGYLIDLLTFNEGHLEGAINIDFFDENFLQDISKLDKNKTLYIYCRSGNRSSKASPKIIDLGFKQLYDLQGGIKNWVKNNYQIVK